MARASPPLTQVGAASPAEFVESALRAMGVAPDRVLAWLGPAIEQDAFEVGPEVREQFVARVRRQRARIHGERARPLAGGPV